MILIVGLGNFGMEYSGTVHNAGFMAVDRLCDNNGIEITKTDFKFISTIIKIKSRIITSKNFEDAY